MSVEKSRPFLSRIAPGLMLMVLAPLVAETLQGATRPSVYLGFPAIFLFEVAVWGGGALFARYFVRKFNLGGLNLLLLALVLSVAEEFLIQQTSIAPLVIQIKGVAYARAFGVNYVYFPWALIYESVFVVLIPVLLTELIFPTRRRDTWLSVSGFIVAALFFMVGALGAWFSWTQIAREKVFHLPHYDPPAAYLLAGVVMMLGLIALALGPFRRAIANAPKPMAPPPPIIAGLLSLIFAVLVEALAAMAFGMDPTIPPAIVLGLTFVVAALALWLVPAWAAHPKWRDAHRYALVFGGVVGNSAAGFLGYLGATPIDFWGKAATNGIALILLIVLGTRIGKPRSGQLQSGMVSSAS
ncbi:MAG TPA: hypothetical protein VG943_11020 [Caulobacterales bacterium]|nr:hypothetical protein [Caulobacterales bacterium]